MKCIKLCTWFIFLFSLSCLADKVEHPLKGGSPRWLYPKIDTAYNPVFFGAGLLVGSWLAFKTAQKYIFPSKKRIISLKASASNKSATGSTQKEFPSTILDSHSPCNVIIPEKPITTPIGADQSIDDDSKERGPTDEEIKTWEKNSITSWSLHCKDPQLRLPVTFGIFAKILTK